MLFAMTFLIVTPVEFIFAALWSIKVSIS